MQLFRYFAYLFHEQGITFIISEFQKFKLATMVIYLELQPVEADRQREIFQTGPFLGLAAVIILAGCGIWFYRVSRLE